MPFAGDHLCHFRQGSSVPFGRDYLCPSDAQGVSVQLLSGY